MNGTASDAIKVHDLFEGSYIFQMPLFQRKYQWKVDDQLKRFWEDLTSLLEEEVETSFLGAIVLQIEEEGSAARSTKYTVIDGQQRITTFFIFISALACAAHLRGWEEKPADLQSEYLVSSKKKRRNSQKLFRQSLITPVSIIF